MAAEKGFFILKVDVDGNGTFQTVGGLRSVGFTFNGEAIDITSMDEDDWKTLLDDAGVKSHAVSGSGVLKNGTPVGVVRTNALAGTLTDFQCIDDAGNIYQGTYKITSFEETGEYNGAQMYSISLESSGSVSYTAA